MDNNAMAVQNALQAGGIQLALPQRLEPITKTERQVQSVQYDPEKLQALIKALQSKRVEPSKMDMLAKALAQAPETRSYTGGFGEEIINPWTSAISALARGFGSAYSNYADARREAENAAREDAIKAAQLEAEASKQAITDTRIDDQIKLNDPNAKAVQAAQTALQQTFEGAGVSKDFDPVKFLKSKEAEGAFSPVARMTDDNKLDKLGIFKAAAGDKNLGIRSAVGADIAKQMQKMVFDVVGKAGSVRIADTEDEKKVIFGPMVNWAGKNANELATLVDQARDRFVVTAREKAKAAGQDISDVSDEDLKRLFNSKFTDYSKIAESYNVPASVKPITTSVGKKYTIEVLD